MVLTLSAPLPGIARHPQKVCLNLGAAQQEIIFKDSEWQQVMLPAHNSLKEWMMLKIETDYTFNPKEAGISRDQRNLGIMIKEVRWEG
jgi:hypothetical protein